MIIIAKRTRTFFPETVERLFFKFFKISNLRVIMKAILVLEDGRVFKGNHFGAEKEEAFGEVVFNTSLSGYQEILTDPSYRGQMVTMTYPLIGNYGVNPEDVESTRPHVDGFIIKELCHHPSNFRSTMSLDAYLKEQGVMGITDVDTRAITRHVRIEGAMKGVISTNTANVKDLVEKVKAFPSLVGKDLVKEVTCSSNEVWSDKGDIKVVVIDCGVKESILDCLKERGCEVIRVPATTSASDILAMKPHGLMLSNGPGDPEGAPYVFETARELLGKLPVFGICLGHQMLGLALGGKTYKLKFGHHGGNQPVMDMETRKVSITAQNHCFCVDIDSVKDKGVEITHMNLNDDTVEGMENKDLKFFSVQFHPEAGPGPNDAKYLFDRFIDNIKKENTL